MRRQPSQRDAVVCAVLALLCAAGCASVPVQPPVWRGQKPIVRDDKLAGWEPAPEFLAWRSAHPATDGFAGGVLTVTLSGPFHKGAWSQHAGALFTLPRTVPAGEPFTLRFKARSLAGSPNLSVLRTWGGAKPWQSLLLPRTGLITRSPCSRSSRPIQLRFRWSRAMVRSSLTVPDGSNWPMLPWIRPTNDFDQGTGMTTGTGQVTDVVVAGAGIGGVSAAVAAARAGARVLLIEAAEVIGGTGVHSPVGLVCTYRDAADRPINVGLHQEFFPHVYAQPVVADANPEQVWFGARLESYDHRDLLARYQHALAAEPAIAIATGTRVVEAEVAGGRIVRVRLEGAHTGWVAANVFVDSTADGNLSALAGAEFRLGRAKDGALQPATLTFGLSNIGFSQATTVKWPTDRLPTWPEMHAFNKEVSVCYQAAQAAGETSNPKTEVFGVPYPDGKSLLFNSTRVLGVDPTKPGSVEAARVAGEQQVRELLTILRRHPAFANATVDFISTKMGVREGRRIVGDYVLTAEDCLKPARFDDMVAACAYMIDIHNPTGSGTRIVPIPPPGYYHIPYRCLRAKGFANLLLGSRCISGTHEAHSSYRVMAPLSAVGQAAGVAAALTVRAGAADVRDISAARIRWVLNSQNQFVEGPLEAPPR